jgi:hypothetical protein
MTANNFKTISKLIVLLFVLCAQNTYSQGCSDSGFCSIDGMKQNDSITNVSEYYANSIKTGLSFGNTRYSVWIINTYIAYSSQINKRLSFSMKIDGQFRSGVLTNLAGLSDITSSVSYKLSKSFGTIAGIKIPSSDGNAKFNGRSMPMAYQTSLGTYDIIAGAQYIHKNLFIVMGWQNPVIQNSNTYISGSFLSEDLGAEYLQTNKYERAGDVLLRVSYNHKPRNRIKNISFIYSLLPIYHLKNDKYVNTENIFIEIKDSKGLTLNTNIFAKYSINTSTALELSLGFPLLARKVRPDGLSQFALTIEFVKRF